MLRKIIDSPVAEAIVLDLPQNLRGRRIEIIAFAIDEENSDDRKMPASSFYGILSPDFGDELRNHVSKSRDEWHSPFENQ